MSSSPPRQNPQNPSKWRYTYEALSHIPTLRLFLSHPQIDPSKSFTSLSAALRLDLSLLHIRLDDALLVTVPVPNVPIDSTSPVECLTRTDHIEVKLALIVPVDHPIAASFRDALSSECGEDGIDQGGPLDLDSDFKSLSGEEVHFYCNTCSTMLTRNSLRNFVEMPSANWREIADNWFGTCCCSFGGVSEKLVNKFVDRYVCTQGTCLLDIASVIVCKDDLQCYSGSECCYGHLTSFDDLTNDIEEPVACEGGVLCTSQIDAKRENCNLWLHEEASLLKKSETKELNESDFLLPQTSSCVTDCYTNDKRVKMNLNSKEVSYSNINSRQNSFYDPSADTSMHMKKSKNLDSDHHCCAAPVTGFISSINDRPCSHVDVSNSAHLESQNLPQDGPLGNGFLVTPSNISSEIRWAEFLCKHCFSVIGSYPSRCGNDDPVDEGVRLFKCCISTGNPVSSEVDKFRRHTLPRIFTNLLLESAVNELSYRTVVRDLNSKSPMLKLVLLNSNVWCSTGHCFENDAVKHTFSIGLQPCVKVLFSNCQFATEDDVRMLEEWSIQNHADEVYMLPSQIHKLTQNLKSWQSALPNACSSFEGMSLSYIDR